MATLPTEREVLDAYVVLERGHVTAEQLRPGDRVVYRLGPTIPQAGTVTYAGKPELPGAHSWRVRIQRDDGEYDDFWCGAGWTGARRVTTPDPVDPRPPACGVTDHPPWPHDCRVTEHVKRRYRSEP